MALYWVFLAYGCLRRAAGTGREMCLTETQKAEDRGQWTRKGRDKADGVSATRRELD